MKLRPRKPIDYSIDATEWVEEHIRQNESLRKKKRLNAPLSLSIVCRETVRHMKLMDLPLEILEFICQFCDESSKSQLLFVSKVFFCILLNTKLPVITIQNEKHISRLRLLYSPNTTLSILHSHKMGNVMKRNSISRLLYLKTYRWHSFKPSNSLSSWIHSLFEQYLSTSYSWKPLQKLVIDFKCATYSPMPFIFYNVETIVIMNMSDMHISRDRISTLLKLDQCKVRAIHFKNGFNLHAQAVSIYQLVSLPSIEHIYIECVENLEFQNSDINTILDTIEGYRQELDDDDPLFVHIYGKIKSPYHFNSDYKTIHLDIDILSVT
mmetsp:Transcript_5698/g.8399  ORF Transcript_5698/g.8399 Transcript_5698/m.8399 type:complete len:323 (-) Transcript_5698:726-1694(-)